MQYFKRRSLLILLATAITASLPVSIRAQPMTWDRLQPQTRVRIQTRDSTHIAGTFASVTGAQLELVSVCVARGYWGCVGGPQPEHALNASAVSRAWWRQDYRGITAVLWRPHCWRRTRSTVPSSVSQPP